MGSTDEESGPDDSFILSNDGSSAAGDKMKKKHHHHRALEEPVDDEKENMLVASRFNSAGDAIFAAYAATDCCAGVCGQCCDVDEYIFAPIHCCGKTYQAASWSVLGVYALGFVSSIAMDLTEGFPGAGMWALAYLAPVVVLILCTADFVTVIASYMISSIVYIMWVLVFSSIRGIEDLETPDGGNVVGIAIGLFISTTPFYSIGTFFMAARRFTEIVVRRRVELCMQAVGRTEADHELATEAAMI